MEIRELLKSIHDKRLTIRARQAELMASIEANLDGETGEDKAAWDKLDKEFSELGDRQNMLLTQLEHEKELEQQRARFETTVRAPEVVEHSEKNFVERMAAWMRAGLPGNETYQPKYFDVDLSGVERMDLTKGTATAGAELIPVSFVRTLYEHLIEFAAIRQTNATVYTTSSGENLLVPKTTGQGAAVLVTEGAALSESDPAYAQITLTAYKFGQLLQVSTELLQDTAVDLLSHLARFTGRALGTVTGTYYVTGTGTAQPQGIANSPTAGKTGATGQTLTVIGNDLVDLYHSVISGYRRNGFWVMNDLSAAIVRKLRDDTGGAGLGNFLWQPGLQAGAPDTIFGRPVVTDPNMAVMAANAFSIAFGDFSQYFAIRDVNSIRFERSDDFAFGNDLVSFRAILRSDSKQIVNGANGAVKFYRNSAT